jgi:hypothetical protein
MKMVCATHGHCFDGLVSAVLFTKLAKALNPTLDSEYRACGYGSNQQHADGGMLNGDENAILDYRFAPLKKLTWFFDHHPTGLVSEEDRSAFSARQGSGRYFFDPSYSSCSKLIFDVARERYQLDMSDLEPLMQWADKVDSARFSSAREAIEREEPALRLAGVVEYAGDDRLLTSLVKRLQDQAVTDVAKQPDIEREADKLAEKQRQLTERVRAHSTQSGRVVFCDLTSERVETLGKFVTYALFPDSEYSVVVGLLSSGVKISVGHNPWSGRALDTDISAICARWGGGGHKFVGGISFRKNELERAQAAARQIAKELSG